jgi:undecaprenyl-diphosphatase
MPTDRAQLFATALKRVVLPLAALIVVMIGLGLWITHFLVHFWPFTIEVKAVRALIAMRTPTLDRLSNLASQSAYIAALSTGVLGAGGAMRLAYHRWREGFFLAAAVLSQLVVYMLSSRLITRLRPAVPKMDHFSPVRSFPSGHVAAAIALYGGIAVIMVMRSRRRWQAVAWLMLFLIPVAVGISRMYRGMHYPSDVAAGILIGFGVLWILRRAMLLPANERGAPHL